MDETQWMEWGLTRKNCCFNEVDGHFTRRRHAVVLCRVALTGMSPQGHSESFRGLSHLGMSLATEPFHRPYRPTTTSLSCDRCPTHRNHGTKPDQNAQDPTSAITTFSSLPILHPKCRDKTYLPAPRFFLSFSPSPSRCLLAAGTDNRAIVDHDRPIALVLRLPPDARVAVFVVVAVPRPCFRAPPTCRHAGRRGLLVSRYRPLLRSPPAFPWERKKTKREQRAVLLT